MQSDLRKKIVHNSFRVTIFLKGINGAWETLVGVFFFIAQKHTVQQVMFWVIGRPDRPGNLPGSFMARQIEGMSAWQYFIGFYFLFYGLVNLFLVISLWQGKRWAFPAAIVFFTLFTVYLINKTIVHHSLVLLACTIFDIVVIILTWLEYKRLREIKILKVE
jgi:uncharacterized membrane protein